ncbi:MAG: class I tRNA ligase family protein [bacterium]|nr:class I tRNA ligase family protein [bacterium]
MEINFPKLEEEVLERWKKEKAFERSVSRRKTGKRFVFYEGPPTANGKPGIHHVLSRAFKDVILRYKTMRGFFVERRAGWDTHGLPVELQIEKKLGLKSKKDIEKYGIAQFNKECKQSVWEYKKEWENLTERMGFWIDLKDPYVTYETSYIETLWRIIQKFWQKGLLYKGHKVILYCSRCGTSLSSHEVAQGYKTVEDTSIYVKFKLKPGQRIGDWATDDSTYILSWTTTPWTLPGNVALAVGEKIQYVRVQPKDMNETYILAKDLVRTVFKEFDGEEVSSFSGKDLIDLSYEQLFPILSLRNEKSHKIYAADFVTTTDGTGVVHTAVMYGEDDYNLGVKVGLPQHHTVTETGAFTQEIPGGLAGLPVRVKETDEKIFAYLKEHNMFLATLTYSHEYPFCWRCSTPLLYYAKDSWFVNMQKVKQALIANNKKINWVPSHLKEGRMGEWLREVKDWAFSRERYWGTPLPIWECKKCEHREVIGSLEELREKTRSLNVYYLLRHGYSEKQRLHISSSWPEPVPMPLLAQGVKEAEKAARALKKKNIDIIISSDLLRTKQTAEIVGKELGVKVVYDPLIREEDAGIFNGKNIEETGKFYRKPGETPLEHYLRRFEIARPEGESWLDVQKRAHQFMKNLEEKYRGKSILIVSHSLVLELIESTMLGLSRIEFEKRWIKTHIKSGEWRKIAYAAFPYNENMEVDLHRPYIDNVVFSCPACKTGTMQRVKEVADVWYDSGAMPFAQAHWPFAKNPKSEIRNPKPPILFPADYIVEGIDQTRGWFYTLLAVSTLLGFSAPYKNVISFSHVLDEKGEKMSKSKDNVVDPWDMIKKYGIDAVRWYFFTMNNPGDPKLFSEKDIQEVLRKFILTLWNSFVFLKTYCPKLRLGTPKRSLSSNVLDEWILSRLVGTTKEITEKMDTYDVTGAGRSLESFVINDLSLWYIRRSRTRFQNPESVKDFKEASTTLSFVLLQTSKLAAPFVPFLSEHIHDALQAKGSVHWEDWPFDSPAKGGLAQDRPKQDKKLEAEMALVRDLVTKALAERAKAQLKVRQPLSILMIKGSGKEIRKDLLTLLKDEINVKVVVFDKNLKNEVELDTALTPQLKEEGQVREILRSIQGMRKEAGYKPQNKIVLWYSGDQELCALISKNAVILKKSVGAKTIKQGIPENGKSEKGKQILFEGKSLWLSIRKI